MQDRSPEGLLGPVKSGSMLCLKFRFDFISMERSWRTLQSRCDMLMRGREGPSSRCWKRKMGDTAEILQGGCCVLAFCWQESRLWVYRLQQHPRRVWRGMKPAFRGWWKASACPCSGSPPPSPWLWSWERIYPLPKIWLGSRVGKLLERFSVLNEVVCSWSSSICCVCLTGEDLLASEQGKYFAWVGKIYSPSKQWGTNQASWSTVLFSNK